MSRQHERPSSTITMLTDIAINTPRPYTRTIGINGQLRTRSMPIDDRIQRSFATQTWPRANKQSRDDRELAGVSKSREDELVSFTGTWIPPSK
ncbi:hypothetical protein CLAFUW4_07634 [Fulvia fulva]|uniref:Uncharacterized protein n=1 Tax=Passalora fulva TaxID=5499 RepID=A0A9Q8P632_PASFU|nr:uncharacterized protein CLAFUR5_07762 [Fulvia fulva]KAK4629654.1 hypothetical protein CLAFUR4_07639 [Fulvia fulva]KAK4629798.1 hypothetical protein CLAFUR0_07639 [Fulvia fulva]UJO14730.1 hypothetical protein CLAFUR5_07762 [Fulvia fulva]WPV12223.1 hypothetical protein CLAFUW4_07634 [Fulvia fulva]WPV28023.1 hypothetical protein CLAFUW7_07635 [Fulvia fulva]